MDKKPYSDGPLTQARLKELFSYDPATGEFVRLCRIGGHPAGPYRPGVNSGGYMRTAIDGRSYVLHRLAWLYVNGVWPRVLLDHRNGNTTDNRLANLREATYAQNVQNVDLIARGKSGFRGVAKMGKKWQASITLNYKQMCLGTFETREQAHQAYLEAKKKYHSFAPNFRSTDGHSAL